MVVPGIGTCTEAAGSGDLGVLMWAREHGCPWDQSCSEAAAGKGDVKMMQRVISSGCPSSAKNMFVAAACSNNLEVLKWLRQQGFQWGKEPVQPQPEGVTLSC